MPSLNLKALRLPARDGVGRLLFSLGVTRPSRSARGLLTIATLHRVLPDEARVEYALGQIAVGVGEFAWLVSFLQEHFTCDTLSSAFRRWSDGERPARPLLAITFDDGQLDNFVHALPVLDHAGVRATFFVPVEAVDRNEPLWHDRLAFATHRLLTLDRAAALRLLVDVGAEGVGGDLSLAAKVVARAKHLAEADRFDLITRVEQATGGTGRPAWDGMMSWVQLRGLAAAGHEIGSHSLTHPLLPGVGTPQLDREVAGSRERIRTELGIPCESFCYPNGDCDDRVVDAVRRAGYRQAVVTAWGPNQHCVDPFRLTRCDLQGPTSRDRFGHLSAERLALRLSPLFARFRR